MSCPECAGYSVPFCPLCEPDLEEGNESTEEWDDEKLEPYFYAGYIVGKSGIGKLVECPQYESLECREAWLAGYNEGLNETIPKYRYFTANGIYWRWDGTNMENKKDAIWVSSIFTSPEQLMACLNNITEITKI